MTARQRQAATQVHRLFGMLPPLDVSDPEQFLTGVIALFAMYAPTVVEASVLTIATKSDRPTLRMMKEVLDDASERAAMHEAREQRRSLPRLKAPPRTPEEQARRDKLAAEARRLIGLPPEGRGRVTQVKHKIEDEHEAK